MSEFGDEECLLPACHLDVVSRNVLHESWVILNGRWCWRPSGISLKLLDFGCLYLNELVLLV